MRLLRNVLFCLCLAPAPAAAERLVVFAAASLMEALDAVNSAYDAAEITTAYAGSSSLARQIGLGAPADVFISANPGWMDWLEARDHLVTGTRANLLTNALVVIGQATAAPLDGLAALPAALGDGRLAVGLTEAVPAGIYARQALSAAGLWNDLKDRTAETDNVRAALQLVAWREASFGIVYATDARASSAVAVVVRIDPALHDTIRYPVALTARAGPGAADYLRYLQSPAARAVFAAHGFGP